MSLRGRVGRHTKLQGRQCQNWLDDQQQVIAFLNLIPVSDGGAGGGLGGRVINGMASDALYAAISRFEDKHFPGQRSGFIDPNGEMWYRLVTLAARKPTAVAPRPAAESPLDILRRNVMDETQVKGRWIARERVALDPLVARAVKHIDSLKELGLLKLPWPVEMFGRAYITKNSPGPRISTYGGSRIKQLFRDPTLFFWDTNDDGSFERRPDDIPLPQMRRPGWRGECGWMSWDAPRIGPIKPLPGSSWRRRL